MLFLLYLLLGCFASFLSGLLGIGGGLLVVPALFFVFTQFQVIPTPQLMHVVIGTSLATSIINLIFSVTAHQRQGAVRWSVFVAMAPGVIAGALLIGPVIMKITSGDALKIIFGVFCLISAAQMIFRKKNIAAQENLPSKTIMILLGLVTGSVSSLLGIAGGMMTGTILNYCRMDMRKIVGTTSAICLVLSISGTIGMMVVGYHQPNLPKWTTGFIYWPAFLGIVLPSLLITSLGANLAHKLPVNILKNIFAVLVFVIGLKMLL